MEGGKEKEREEREGKRGREGGREWEGEKKGKENGREGKKTVLS